MRRSRRFFGRTNPDYREHPKGPNVNKCVDCLRKTKDRCLLCNGFCCRTCLGDAEICYGCSGKKKTQCDECGTVGIKLAFTIYDYKWACRPCRIKRIHRNRKGAFFACQLCGLEALDECHSCGKPVCLNRTLKECGICECQKVK